MADIKPFSALRYDLSKAGKIEDLTCPPYDIISEEQRIEFISRNQYNAIRLELPKGEEPYKEAKNILSQWISDGILKTDMDPGIYIYEQEFLSKIDRGDVKRLRGLICRVRLEDFSSGVILPHEETLSKAKEDRFNLMQATNCNFSQIYSLYQDDSHITRERLDNLASGISPRYEFSDGLVTHRLWVVNDTESIKAIEEDFVSRKLYIADGHHRYETALNYKRYLKENNLYCPGGDYIMMMLVDMDNQGLVVFPTHRIIKDISNFSTTSLLESCKDYFEVVSTENAETAQEILKNGYDTGKHCFAFYDGANWKVLVLIDSLIMDRLLPDKSITYRNLDVTILHTLILERLMGIDKENMASQKNLSYTRSINEAIDSVDRGEGCCCFLLNPTRVEEISSIASCGEKMPQKSTYFYPKLITGLVMNSLNTL